LNGGFERYLYDGAGERVARVTAPGMGTKLYTINPCRIIDTRSSPPAVQAPRVVQVTGTSCGVPLDASGIVGNLAAIPPASPSIGFLNLYATGTNPGTSTLNFNANQVRANNFQLGLSGNGQVSLVASSSVDAILDVVGYFKYADPTWAVTFRDEVNRLSTEYSVPQPGTATSRTRSYFYLGNLLVATRNSSGVYTYWASDHLGTPRVSTGAVSETHKYQPFGTEITSFGSQPIKFAAMERDASSGNDFDHARYQSSLLARFLSPDKLTARAADPQTWNRFSYARNNPVGLVDPSGADSAPAGLLEFLQSATAALRDATTGYFRTGMEAINQSIGRAPGMTSTTPGNSVAHVAGQDAAVFFLNHATALEIGVSAKTVTTGIAVVNFNDAYGFAGGTSPPGRVAPPVVLHFSAGVVENYAGQGSYAKLFVSATSSAPIGATVASNPLNPGGPTFYGVTFSTDAPVQSQSVVYYVPLSDVPEKARAKQGLFFYRGRLVRVLPPGD
jgi:RHS repeat-associated protein